MTDAQRLLFLRAIIVLLAAVIACVVVAASVHACACPIPPAPVPCARLYLPTVQRAPAIAAESSPWVPVPTLTPDPDVTGNVAN